MSKIHWSIALSGLVGVLGMVVQYSTLLAPVAPVAVPLGAFAAATLGLLHLADNGVPSTSNAPTAPQQTSTAPSSTAADHVASTAATVAAAISSSPQGAPIDPKVAAMAQVLQSAAALYQVTKG